MKSVAVALGALVLALSITSGGEILAAECTSGPCDYIGRCNDDMFLFWETWEQTPKHYVHTWDSTLAVCDGEGWNCHPFRVWFLHDMLWTRATGTTITYAYHGEIVSYSPTGCDTVAIAITEFSPFRWYNGLAYDPRDGGSFWVSKFSVNQWPAHYWLVHLDMLGQEIDSYGASHAFTGLAFDSKNNHLWGIFSGQPDMLMEWDVSSGAPNELQGPLPVPWPPGTPDGSAAGLEYCERWYEQNGLIVAIDRSTGSQVWIEDLDPSYPGGKTGGKAGVSPFGWCSLAGTPSPWGVALAPTEEWCPESPHVPQWTTYVAGSPDSRPYPLDKYSWPWGPTRVEATTWGSVKSLFRLPGDK